MRLTSKGRYAVRAMLDLTTHSGGDPVRLQEISTRQSISLHYLEQLFRKLRNGGVVKSVRGPGGGYVLARHQDEISVRRILDSVGEIIDPARDILKDSEVGNSTIELKSCRGFFENLGAIMEEYLATTSLGDISRKAVKEHFVAQDNGDEIEGQGGGSADRDSAPHDPRPFGEPFGEVNQ